jgi:CDP-paratose 2-epimerase
VRILITGVCGFVGSTIAQTWIERTCGHTLFGVDSLVRPGSETNRQPLKNLGVGIIHADVRSASDLERLPAVDWVIEAAACPSVLAGVDGKSSSRQLIEHNLVGTINVLEYCKAHRAGFILLSTSRVYSIAALAALPVEVHQGAYRPLRGHCQPGFSGAGIAEAFPTSAPVSLYGATKLASEQLALEYGEAFGFPVRINRCGVLAGGGQFGRADQGIFSYWIRTWARKGPLAYTGFDGEGHQVRDCLHPRDLVPLLDSQIVEGAAVREPIVNVSGGTASACSLRACSDWCAARFGAQVVSSQPEPRAYDIPWIVLDSARAGQQWGWAPQTPREAIFEEIAVSAERQPDWLDISMA